MSLTIRSWCEVALRRPLRREGTSINLRQHQVELWTYCQYALGYQQGSEQYSQRSLSYKDQLVWLGLPNSSIHLFPPLLNASIVDLKDLRILCACTRKLSHSVSSGLNRQMDPTRTHRRGKPAVWDLALQITLTVTITTVGQP
jgi:hypothetical protein